ncbi:MAG: carotenoid biosynthesis protein [Cytophagales bacterium]|nr:carotenoid biosynthesis protein [Bernardetiaceae bacterium]MDW8205145.1 carotenoid biosynthesis protein [Cytophagales bacterium]
MLCPVGAWQLFHWLALLIASMHFFGFWLMLWQPTSAFFVSLTPLNLLISLGMLLYFHSHRTLLFFISCLLIWAGGFLVELAGVQTGQLFGQYAYGDVLGIKLWDTPLIIGVNWLLLIYAISALVAHQPWQIWQKALFVGTGMTLMDVLIEPFAIRFGLWHWFGESVPLQNYIAWLITGTIMAAVFLYLNQKISLKNRMAAVVLLSQCFFFCAHNLAIWFVA